MNARDKELAEQATTIEHGADRGFDRVTFDTEKFAALIRADEREAFVAFIQSYPHWLGNKAKEEIVQAIRARGTP